MICTAARKWDLCAAKRFAQVEMIKILYFPPIGSGVVLHKKQQLLRKDSKDKNNDVSCLHFCVSMSFGVSLYFECVSLYFDMTEVNLDIGSWNPISVPNLTN